VLQAALAGADLCTMRFDALEKRFDHPMTGIGLKQFLKDWEQVPT
jgi:transaldolase